MLYRAQCFLYRCHRRRYISKAFNIYDLLEKRDGKIFDKVLKEGLNGGGGPLVGCRLKFSNFVGSGLKFSIFVGSRLNVSIFVGRRKIAVNK